MSNFCIIPFISQTRRPYVVYIPTVGHMIQTCCVNYAQVACDVPHLHSACATCHSHVNNIRNVKNIWNNCQDNDRVHSEFRNFLLLSNFGMSARIIIIYNDFLLTSRRLVMSSQITHTQSSTYTTLPIVNRDNIKKQLQSK